MTDAGPDVNEYPFSPKDASPDERVVDEQVARESDGTSGSTATQSGPSQPRIVRADQLVAGLGSASTLTFLPLLGVSGYIVQGWSHLLAGYPRTGKTALTVRLVQEWATAGTPVLYITEESDQLWAARLAALSGDWQANVHLCFGLGAASADLIRVAFERSEPVVMLDGIRSLLRLQDENDNSEVARVITPWIAGARSTHKTFVALHHTRKGGGSGGEGIAGAHALLGSFDVAIELLRSDSAPRRRIVGPMRASYRRLSLLTR